MKSFGCMPAVRTPEASRTLTVSCPGILPSPLRDKVGAFHHDRFRGYVSVHFRSGLHPPCLRFAVPATGHHARLGTRLLVRLCRGRRYSRLNSMRLQGATPHRTGRDTLASSGSHCSAASIEQTPVSKQPRLMACDARQPASGSPLVPAQGLELSARPPRQGQVDALQGWVEGRRTEPPIVVDPATNV